MLRYDRSLPAIGDGMKRARLTALIIGSMLPWLCDSALAQRGNSIDSLAAQMNQAGQSGNQAEGLALAQKLEGLVRRRQGTTNMNYAGVLHNEGMFLQNLGRYPEAIDKLNAALAIKLRNNDAASTIRTSDILVASLGMLDQRAEASKVAERALAIGTSAFGADDVRLTGTLAALGGLARDNENYKEAESYFQRALSGRQKSSLAAPYEVASSLDDLGDLYGLEGRFDDGEHMLKEGLALLERTYGANAKAAPNYDKALNDLGNLYKDAGRFADAERTFRQALAMMRSARGEDHPNTAAALGNLATVLEAESRFDEAEDAYKKTLAVYEKLYGPSHPLTAIALNNLANVYADQGRMQDSAGLQQRVVAIDEKVFGPNSPDVARALNNLANSYRDLGRQSEVLPLYERALRIMTATFGG